MRTDGDGTKCHGYGTHHFIKDSAITTKVEGEIGGKHLSTLTRIKVDTDAAGLSGSAAGANPMTPVTCSDDCQGTRKASLRFTTTYSRT